MVRVRLVDSPVSSESEDMVEMIEVPDHMFADGEEPVGIRVLAYHRSSGIRSILRVLSDDEIQFIKDSTFGKFIDLADKPALSGCYERKQSSTKKLELSFVHAMQLAMVEAVPALTEVVQEAGSSSSESESDREDDDLHEKHNKRLTLSPGHARDVDHKCEVPVKCIIEDDSSHPVDNEYEDYSNEETDPKVENVLRLHSEKHDFNNSMFKRGLTMADVERMGGKGKGKKKETKDGKKAMSPETVSDSKEFASMESRVGTLVENKIKSMIQSVMVPMLEQKTMKGDIIQSIETMIKNQHQDPIINSKSQPSSFQPSENTYVRDEPQHFPEGDIHDSPTRGLSSDISGLTPSPIVTSLENQMEHSPASKTVATQNVRTGRLEMALRDPFPFIENPSFSLGLSQEEKQDHTDGRSSQEPETVEEDNQDKLPQRRKSLRLRNSLNTTLPPSTSVDQISEMESFPVIEIPSFSLGLSQDDNNDDLVNGLAAEQVANAGEAKDKKTVTHGLVDVYGKADSWEYTQKYTKLAQKLKSHFVIHLGGCQVSNKDIIDIAKPYSSKVVESSLLSLKIAPPINLILCDGLLMKHLSLSYAKQSLTEEGKNQKYSKFSKIPAKETHMFTKGLVEVFGEMVDHHPDHYIFYFPFNLDKKHWDGLCVDASSWIITVFDCNTSLRSEASMNFELKPISEMFPYLMKQVGLRISNSQLMPMVVEREKTVPQNIISADSSLTLLLMQTHSLSGIETCRCIAPHILASEAQRVAAMLYEYHMKL
ncbi:LOW QUALITY PROTEIN: hypothetical protein HID58_075406 [Brassica napus]|uniref:Ubiquitin-like protease family profile domain-containing protein n=2 Tax=Brassica napus TaxID=3708 RepID=A0ABQ7YJJ4_BRANA|nr:LOW QUALITY PROTEIN: hypothetical protein HID58_075406 [Brassica napus]